MLSRTAACGRQHLRQIVQPRTVFRRQDQSALGIPVLALKKDNIPPIQIGLIGAGAGNMYTAYHVIKTGLDCEITIMDQNYRPYGLVENAVAPDHLSIKKPTQIFESKVLKDPRVQYLAPMKVGSDIAVPQLEEMFDYLVVGTGAQYHRRLEVPGNELPHVCYAGQMYMWYNTALNPSWSDGALGSFLEAPVPLKAQHLIVNGSGNVALDMLRMLTKPLPSLLDKSDLSTRVAAQFQERQVGSLTNVARRGVVQTQQKLKDLRELEAVPGVVLTVDPADLVLSEADNAEVASDKEKGLIVDFFRSISTNKATETDIQIHFAFKQALTAIDGTSEGVTSVTMEKNQLEGPAFQQKAEGTGTITQTPCDGVINCLGQYTEPIPGLPYSRGRFQLEGCQFKDMPHIFASGWALSQRGLVGDSNRMAKDLIVPKIVEVSQQNNRPGSGAWTSGEIIQSLLALSASKGHTALTKDEWLVISTIEKQRAVRSGQPKEKFTEFPLK